MAITEHNGSASKLVGLLRYDGHPARGVFDERTNADGLTDKWIALRDEFARAGVRLLTEDEMEGRNPDFELHINVQKVPPASSAPIYVILTECAFLLPENGSSSLLGRYRKRFSWNDDLVAGGQAIKIQLAHRLAPGPVDGFGSRSIFCSMIAANKALPMRNDAVDLYRERVHTIRWFERTAPNDFVLYGTGWNLSARMPGRLGGIRHRMERVFLKWMPRHVPFRSWQGAIARKRDALLKSRFTLAYENVQGLRGYITEKIFDAMCSGCVPVYWGASNVTDFIPADCFIDRRQFASHNELYRHMKGISENEYRRYQEAMRAFLASVRARPFSAETFSETVVNVIVSDLREQGIAV